MEANFATENVVCFLCGADYGEVVHHGPDLLLGHPGHFRLVQCRHCGLIYQNPRPADLRPFYEGDYLPFRTTASALGEDIVVGGAAANYRRLLHQVIPSGTTGALLDVGCATGDFLVAMQAEGWQVTGCDASDAACAVARRRLGAAATIKAGELEKHAFPSASFDVVTLWHSLEHMPNPRTVLAEVRRVLRPNGVVLLQTPAWLSLESQLWKRSWVGWDAPRHTVVFSPRTLRLMLEATGLVVQQSLRDWSYYNWILSCLFFLGRHLSPQHLAHVHSLLKRPFVVRYFRPFFWVVDHSPLCSQITFAAQRTEYPFL